MFPSRPHPRYDGGPQGGTPIRRHLASTVNGPPVAKNGAGCGEARSLGDAERTLVKGEFEEREFRNRSQGRTSLCVTLVDPSSIPTRSSL